MTTEVVNEKEASGQAVPNVGTGTTVTQGFGETGLTRTAETASAAVAAQATAAIQARYVMAMQRPRDIDEVRQKLIKECKRPGFARVARYRKPVGEGIVGPSIRFAEVAIRCMTNMFPEVVTTFDDRDKRIVRVSVTDLEANVTYSQEVVVEKTVERSKVPDGGEAISMRTNSAGKRTYLLAANEDDLLNKQNALISKALRNLGLRLVPGDLIDDAMAQVTKTQEDDDAKDPDAARKAVADSFLTFGVKAADLKAYLGHELGAATFAELVELRSVGMAIKDGETNWRDALDHKNKSRASNDTEKPGDLKSRAKAKAEKVEHDPLTGEIVPPAVGAA